MEEQKEDEEFFDEMEKRIKEKYHKQQSLTAKRESQRINMKLVQKCSIPEGDLKGLTQEEIADKMINLKELHLEYCKIPQIENLEIFENLVGLHLEHNLITTIENLELNSKLEFLCLRDNQIHKIENLKSLKLLCFLDVSHNLIEEVNTAEISDSLMTLIAYENPCCSKKNYRKNIVTAMGALEELDKAEISLEERLLYKGVLTSEISKKVAEKNLKDKLELSKKVIAKSNIERTEEEKKTIYEGFASLAENSDFNKQTLGLVNNSKARFQETRKESLQTLEHINSRFASLMKHTE